MFKVLDLFSGIGGTARGIIKYLYEKNIVFEYTAIDNNPEAILAYTKNIPFSFILNEDAYTYDFKGYNFIWASPPCKTHSCLNMYSNRKEPDMRLWALIKKLSMQKIPYVVENVLPYYKSPIKSNFKIGRHLFWSNIPFINFRGPVLPKDFSYMNLSDWMKYHSVGPGVIDHIEDKIRKRQILRNMVRSDISYNLIKQFFEPKQSIL